MSDCTPSCGHWAEIEELKRLQRLVIAWADANDAWVEAGVDDGYREPFKIAHDELRKAVGR